MTKPQAIALGVGVAGATCGLAAVAVPAPWLDAALAWTAAACAVASAAYAGNRPAWFGKRGGRLTWRTLPVAPYLAAFHGACALMRWWRPRDRPSEVAGGIWVSGRVRFALPPGVTTVVDLTAEFAEPITVRHVPGYRSLPVLDGAAPPDPSACLALLGELAAQRGGVLVHCDAGRGRAPTFAAALLLARGVAADVESAWRIVRAGRPVASPSSVDRDFVAALAPALLRLASRDAAGDSPERAGDARTAPEWGAPC